MKDAAEGDYYATVSVVDYNGTAAFGDKLLEDDSQIVYNSAAPLFNRLEQNFEI